MTSLQPPGPKKVCIPCSQVNLAIFDKNQYFGGRNIVLLRTYGFPLEYSPSVMTSATSWCHS